MMFAATTVISFPDLGWGPFTLNRFVFEDLFGFLSVAWYGLIICIGMILGCGVVLWNAVKREGFEFDSFLDYFIFTIPLAVVGARVMYVAAQWEQYDSFMDMIAIWNGGIAIYGGVLTGILVVLIVAKVKKHNPLKVFDAMIPGLFLGQAIGRWGNFVNGEAFGEETSLPWGMMVNGEGPFHPTFFYESLITFTGFLLSMFLIYRIKKADGQVFSFYLVWYGIGRTLVETLRLDSLYIGSFRLAQCIGIFTAMAGIVLFVFLSLVKDHSDPVPAEGEVLEEKDVAEETSESSEEASESPEKTNETSEKEEKEANAAPADEVPEVTEEKAENDNGEEA